jgi:signal transduction histidine kinase
VADNRSVRARRTLRGKVSLLGLVVIGGWVVILLVSFNLLFAVEIHGQADDTLRNRAATAAATVRFGPNGAAQSVSEGAFDGALDSGIWIYSTNGSVVRPDGDEKLQKIADELSTGPARFKSSGDQERLYSLPLTHDGERAGTVVASVSLDPYRRATHAAWFGSGVVAILLLIGAYPVLRIAAGRALRPVDVMTKQAAEWSANAVDERFGDSQPLREIQTLAGTLDGVLDRLAAVVRHERQLSAELSHELRTPLARVLAETDLLMSRPHSPEELQSAHQSIRDSAMAMERILETLLAAARAEIRDAPGRCDLAPAASRAVSAVQQVDGVTIRSSVGDLVVGMDAAVLERVLAPILDNAMRYAVSRVSVTARQTRDAIYLNVDDDGPGVPEELRETIFEPGFRGEVEDGHDGAGLGLALSRRLARAAAGDVAVTGAQSTFEVRLPRA